MVSFTNFIPESGNKPLQKDDPGVEPNKHRTKPEQRPNRNRTKGEQNRAAFFL
jgi:hypothetical protein